MTADEFLALPPIDYFRHAQLIDGELVENHPNLGHQRIVLRLAYEIGMWVRGGPDRGEVLFMMASHLSDYDVFLPDVVWLGPGYRYPDDDGALVAPPDLVVEVRSPSTWHLDQGHKRRLYEAAGVAELWLVDHDTGTVETHRRSSPDASAFEERHTLTAGDGLTTPLLPGLALDVATLFAAADL